MTMPDFEVFKEMNTTSWDDEMFDSYFDNKRDLGKVLRKLSELVEVDNVFKQLFE